MDLPYVSALLNKEGLSGAAWSISNYMFQQDSVYIGSNDSMSPSGWNGDDIYTGTGNDTVKAKGGDDFITDSLGKDLYIGGSGWDTVSYAESYWNPQWVKQGIKVDLTNKKIVGYDGKTDTVKGIEDVHGTFKKDSFIGDNNSNIFMGFQGRDRIDGGGGFDTASYRFDAFWGGTGGIVANLAEGTVRDGFGNNDKITDIEQIEGTSTDDIFIDGKGDDVFLLGDGNDTVYFSKGDDYADASGGGADLFVFKGDKFGHDIIYEFDDSQGDKLQIMNASTFLDLTIFQKVEDTVVLFRENTITLIDFIAGDLDAGDFIFV